MTDNVTASTTDHLAGDIPDGSGITSNGSATASAGAAQVSDTAALDAITGEHDADQVDATVSASVADPAAADPAAGGTVDGAGAAGGAQGTEDDDATAGQESRPSRSSRRAPAHEQLVAEGDAAGDYLERLLDILDYDGDIDLDVEGERAVVSIIGEGDDVANLVGDRGEVLDALQELTRLAATAETGQRSRLMLDVAGYRARRRTELSELGERTAREVQESGEAVRLAPMNPFERKIVHDAVATVDGVGSSSEGEEPRRRVVVSPSA